MATSTRFRNRRYSKLRLLGTGGMGRVYLARDLLDEQREVALKLYPSSVPEDILRREFSTLRELHHPNIAKAFHFGVNAVDGSPFFTMEYIRGEPLDAYLDGLRRPGEPAPSAADGRDRLSLGIHLFRQAASALAYLHRRGVLHLDIKPNNILVVDLGEGRLPQPILIDFGLVRPVAGPGHVVERGTAPYVAPEFFRGDAPGPPYDIYSLGVTFYRALSGRVPFTAGSIEEYAKAHLGSPPPPLPELPVPLAALVLRMLAKDPSLRFADGEELQRTLSATKLPGVSTSVSPPVFHPPDFVGRSKDLKAFHDWRRTAPCRSPLVVHGNPGVGKSRLLERFETLLEIEGQRVLRLECLDLEERLLGEVLRRLSVLFGRPSQRSRDERLLLVASGERKPDQAIRQLIKRSPASELRKVILRLAVRRVADVMERQGLYLILDDLHAGGATACEFFVQLAGRLGARREARVGSDPRVEGGLIASVSSAGRERLAALADTAPEPRWLELHPLSARETARLEIAGLRASLAGLSPSEVRTLKRNLHRQTGGNPLFFLQGLLSLRADSGSARRRELSDRFRSEIAALDPQERRLLVVLTALGRPAPARELAAILKASVPQTTNRLRRLRHAGLLAAGGTAARIVHEDVRSATEAAVEAPELKVAHAVIGLQLVKSTETLAEGARHLFLGDREKEAITASRRLLETQPARSLRWDENASSVFLRAADALKERSPQSLRFLEAAGDLLEVEGRFNECLEVRTRVVSLMGLDPRHRRRGKRSRRESPRPGSVRSIRPLRKLASALHRAGAISQALCLLDDCLDALKDAPDARERIHVLVEKALLCHFRQRGDEALSLAGDGLKLWKRLPTATRWELVQPALNLHAIVGQIHIRRLHADEAIRWLREGVELAREAISPANTAVLLNNLGLAYHMANRFGEALETFHQAESAARETQDHPALVTVFCNMAQIHAKTGRFTQAREALTSAGRVAATRQSLRLRLSHAYTYALVHGLLGQAVDRDWSGVQALAREAGDRFLTLCAGLFRAEALIEAGQLGEAKELLSGRGSPPILRKSQLARLAYLEALAGRTASARNLRRRYGTASGEATTLLADWDRLYLGASAAETADLGEAREHYRTAEGVFRSSRTNTGRLEAVLRLGDLALRQGSRRDVEHWIGLARRLAVEPLEGVAPRLRELRTTLHEARAMLLEGGSRREDRASVLGDLIARAAGDPLLENRPLLRLELGVLRTAHAILAGDFREARRAGIRVRLLQRRLLRVVSSPRRRGRQPRDPWSALGLETFRPPEGRVIVGPTGGPSLTALLAEVVEAREPRAAIARGLASLAEAIGADRAGVELRAGAGTVARWSRSRGTPRKRRIEIVMPLPFLGTDVGRLKVLLPTAAPVKGSQVALLEAGARALAPLCAVLAGAAGSPTAGASVQAEAPRPAESSTKELETQTLEREAPERPRRAWAEGFVAESREMLRVLGTIERLRDSDLPVLITGESGTGKDHVARLVHQTSKRARGPFLTQNCSSLSPELLEADLFGYKRGAFSGADKTRTGFLFRAQGGSFHLEEIGDVSMDLQKRLLRFIEEKAVRPVGATGLRRLDVRFIASTQRDVEALVRRGEFRKDLFYRLNGACIHVPPLRQHPEDVPALIELHSRDLPEGPLSLSGEAVEVLTRHSWPGNVRELITVLRRLAIESQGRTVSAGQVEDAIGPATPPELFSPTLFTGRPFEEVQRALEESYLRFLLDRHAGNLGGVARELKTSTRSVYRRFERLGLKPGELEQRRK